MPYFERFENKPERARRDVKQPWLPFAWLDGPRWRSWGARALRVASWLLPAALLAYLGYRLDQIGWAQIWRARPAGWTYYAVLGTLFFVQPIADLVVYRNLWRSPAPLRLSIILRKRLLNALALEYSGEAYFCAWAMGCLELPRGVVLHAIKDSNVLSAAAGLATVVVMVSLLALTAGAAFHALPLDGLWVYGPLVAAPPLVLLAVIAVARRHVTVLSARQLAQTFSLHFARSLVGEAFQFALWLLSGAIASPAVCLEFVVLKLLISRLPIGVSKDLVFVGTGMAAAQMLNLSTTAVAAVLTTLTASDYLLNLSVVGLPWLFGSIRAPFRDGGVGT